MLRMIFKEENLQVSNVEYQNASNKIESILYFIRATLTSVQQEIINIIKRFKFEELELSIMPIFPEISWDNVRSELIKHHKNFTSANVGQVIKMIITQKGLKEKILTDRLLSLHLIDISWHSNKKMWYGYTLTGSNKSANYLINREIQNNMIDNLNSLNIKINLKIYTHNNITYVSLVETKRNKKNKVQHTMFFCALFMGQKYFFSTKKNIPSDILNAITRSLGYEDVKRLKVMGRDLKSLSVLCWKRKEGAMNAQNINKTLIYEDDTPDRKKTGVDFTQQKQRKKYARACFGDNPPILEVVVVNGPTRPISHEDISKKLPNINIQATWEFRSQNIAAFLSKLIERRILVTPVPHYISNLMILGKNELTLKSD
ncbi:uncharacterized protein LOC122536242 isoform X2 [Frieseomelitta varia]|uniref:uncharacterized protein LOC122536242 isoform X2 n=1 Tax=Frieseomelitta varia TaxID=561572 RepID=UPI001CB692AC|nr:uncharacterized protein LOC122536242 isoform X2 [Frieseomelitta varia]